jgi:Spy/CpxP family protein refolding chaperone
MKKVILFAACLFTLSTAVNAQETARKPKTEKAVKENLTPEQRAQRNVDNLNAVAGLSDEQKTKVKDLATTRITKADAIKAKYKGQAENKETMQNEIAAVRKEYRQSVKAILTPEQIEKLKSRKKEGKGAENVIDAND